MSENTDSATEPSVEPDDDGSSAPAGEPSAAAEERSDGATPTEGVAAGDPEAEVVVETTPSIKPALVYLAATFLVGLAVVGYIFQNPTLLGDTETTEILLNIAVILWAIALARLLFRIYVLSRTTYYITTRAVRREYNILYREWSRELPLVQVRGHDRSRNRLQQTFDIGTIAFLTAGSARSPGHLEFVHIADDDEVRRQARRLIEVEQD